MKNVSKNFKEGLAFHLIDLLNHKEWNEINQKSILERFKTFHDNKLDWVANDKIALINVFFNVINTEILCEAKKDFIEDPDASIREKLTDIILRKCEKHKKHKTALLKLRNLTFYDPSISIEFLLNINFLTRNSLLLCGDDMEGFRGKIKIFGVSLAFCSIFEKWVVSECENEVLLMKTADRYMMKAEEIGRGINII